jgi:3-hexulose-6-phosphate synthase
MPGSHIASASLVERLRSELTFQISVDVDNIPLGLSVAEASLDAGITIVEMGTPLLKCVGLYNVIPAFRAKFPDALLLADMKTMDGGGFEARAVYKSGGNIIDFLATAGVASAKAACAVRDEFRAADPGLARLAFADILLPHQGPAATAVDVAQRMLDAGVDGVGLHLQLDSRRADPKLWESSYLSDVARAVFEKVGDRGSVQVVGGLSIEQAKGLARDGLKALVISGNLGIHDGGTRYTLPPAEIGQHVATFIREVSAAAR